MDRVLEVLAVRTLAELALPIAKTEARFRRLIGQRADLVLFHTLTLTLTHSLFSLSPRRLDFRSFPTTSFFSFLSFLLSVCLSSFPLPLPLYPTLQLVPLHRAEPTIVGSDSALGRREEGQGPL